MSLTAEQKAAKAALDAKREAAAAARADALVALELEWEDKLGPRGSAFEIVEDTGHGEGHIVLKLGDAVLQKRFEAEQSKGLIRTSEDAETYVLPCVVHPDQEAARAIFARRPFLITRCAGALLELFGLEKRADQKK